MNVIEAADFEESWIDMERIVNELLIHRCQVCDGLFKHDDILTLLYYVGIRTGKPT